MNKQAQSSSHIIKPVSFTLKGQVNLHKQDSSPPNNSSTVASEKFQSTPNGGNTKFDYNKCFTSPRRKDFIDEDDLDLIGDGDQFDQGFNQEVLLRNT